MKQTQYQQCRHYTGLGNCFRLSLLAIGMAWSLSASAAPTILNATESAKAADTIGVQGSDYGDNASVLLTPVNSSGVDGTQVSLAIANTGTNYLAAQIPAAQALGLYKLAVRDASGNVSQTSYINRARITSFEFPEVDPGRQFRLFGRNLVLAGATPSVRFVDTSTLTSYAGTVVSGGDPYVVTVQAPASLVAGHTYTVYYKNGFGGTVGEIAAPDLLTVRTGGTDALALGVPWGVDFGLLASNVYNVLNDSRLAVKAVGDGVTDDMAAIQGAINAANTAGGGVVYLPAGTYRVATCGGRGGGELLTLKSNVVLKGDGQTSTTIALTAASSITTTTGMVYSATNSNTMGVMDMTLLCSNTNTATTASYPIFMVATDTQKAFFLRTTFDGGSWSPDGLQLAASTGGRFLVSGCEIKNIRRSGYPLKTKVYGSAPNKTQYVYIRGNSIPNLLSTVALGGKNIVFENNNIVYDGDYYNYVVNTLGQTSTTCRNRLDVSGPNHILLSNTFSHVGAPYVDNNSGETILCEDLGQNGVASVSGTATGGSATTLSDTSKAMTASQYIGYNVVIVDGPGAGQVRTITANTTNTVTVDTPWLVTPGVGSKYCVAYSNVAHLLVKGNTMINKWKTFVMNLGGYDVAVVQNTSTDSGPIWVRSHFRQAIFTAAPLMNVLIADNVLSGTGGVIPPMVKIDQDYYDVPRFGTATFLLETRRNSVDTSGHEAFWGVNTWDGQNMDRWHPDGDLPPYATVGLIFDGNTAANAATAYGWVPGNDGMVISKYTNSNIWRTAYDITHGDGTITAGPSWSGSGTLLFSGTGSVEVGAVTCPPVMTIEGKFKTTMTTEGTLFSNRNIGKTIVSVNGGKLTIWDNLFSKVIQPSTLVNNGAWHHYAWVCDGINNTVYLDGTMCYTGTNTLRTAYSGPGHIGVDQTSTTRVFTGEMDEIRLWNTARTQAQIQAYKDTAVAGDEPGLFQYWRLNEGAGTLARNNVLGTEFSEDVAGYWKFDEGSGSSAADASGNGNDGTAVGTLGWVAGTYGTAARLDGTTNYVSVPDSPVLRGTAALTVHAKVTIGSISSNWALNWRGILAKDIPHQTYCGWELGTQANSANPTAVGFFFRRGCGVGPVAIYAPTNLVAGRTYSVAATYNPTNGQTYLYVDGQLAASGTNTVPITSSTGTLQIGARGGSARFDGVIDDARVYSRVLSAEEIKQLHAP